MKKNKILQLMCVSTLALSVVACNGGGGSGGNGGNGYNGSFSDTPVPAPYGPTPPPGIYPANTGISYSSLTQPNTVANGVLQNSYPESYFPVGFQTYGLQIAYGRNNESAMANLAGYVQMYTFGGTYICTATPVKYESATDTTFFVGAAHCFVQQKANATTLQTSDMLASRNVTITYGKYAGTTESTFNVQAIYLRQDYCYNATFSLGSECPNFTPSNGVSNGQGNDVSVIQVKGQFGNPALYPQLAAASQYPTTYTMAPVLSIGYGDNISTKGNPYYVAGYQYWQQDATGYHYLYNSYYNFGSFAGQTGYTALICGGDSGGPDLFWTGSNWLLLSEHTYGPGDSCGQFFNYLPNGATNVSAYYDWIMSILNSATPTVSCASGAIQNCVTR